MVAMLDGSSTRLVLLKRMANGFLKSGGRLDSISWRRTRSEATGPKSEASMTNSKAEHSDM